MTKTVTLPHTKHISPSAELTHRIMSLKYKQAQQEEQLRDDLKRVRYELSPSTLVKSTFKSLKDNASFRNKVLGTGASLLLGNFAFRKVTGIKKYLVTEGAKRLFNFITKKRK
jgi:hypothetical protein